MGDQHLFVTSVLIEGDADIERFAAVARERFRSVWPLGGIALAMYDKDFAPARSAASGAWPVAVTSCACP
jgi:hypothetical protein